MENPYAQTHLPDPNPILVRAGLLSIFRLGLVPETTNLILALPKESANDPETTRVVRKIWRNLQQVYVDGGGDVRYLREALKESGSASKCLGPLGYNGGGFLPDILGNKAYSNEVQGPLMDAGHDPRDFTVSLALASVMGLVQTLSALGAIAGKFSEEKPSTAPEQKAENASEDQPKKERGFDWKWAVILTLVGAGVYAWVKYEDQKSKWNKEREKWEEEREELRLEMKAIREEWEEAKMQEPPRLIPSIPTKSDLLTDLAISNALAGVARKQSRRSFF